MSAFSQRLGRRVLRWGYDSVEVDGLWVGAPGGEALVKAQDALRLIRETDPRRYARLRKDLDAVWVHWLPGPLGRFVSCDWTCELDRRFVAEAPVEQIASTIVHEATHARLWRRGVGYDKDIRHRVEAVCFRQEQAFAARLPASEDLEGHLAAYLECPAESWSDSARWRHGMHSVIAEARDTGMPRWLLGFVLRRGRAARRRRRRAETARLAAAQPPIRDDVDAAARHHVDAIGAQGRDA